jgi:hypothetical protein
MEGGPDVVEELDLHHRLQAPERHADGAAHDVGLGQGRVEDAGPAELPLESRGHLEDAALPLHLLQELFAAHVRHVLPEDDDPRVPLHLVTHARVEEVHHGGLVALEGGRVLGVEIAEVGSTSSEYSHFIAVSGRRLRLLQGPVGRLVDLLVDLLSPGVQLLRPWRSPRPPGSFRNVTSGSRAASASRSSSVRYIRSSSDMEWE